MTPEDLDDDADQKPWRLMDARYWAAMAFLVLCLLAATVVAVWGPTLWPRHPHAGTREPAPAHATESPNRLPLRPDPR